MVMTLDIPDKILQEAEARGVSVESYLQDAFADDAETGPMPGFTRIAGLRGNPKAAAASIREIASRNTLGGLKIKDLVNEGRKY